MLNWMVSCHPHHHLKLNILMSHNMTIIKLNWMVSRPGSLSQLDGEQAWITVFFLLDPVQKSIDSIIIKSMCILYREG